MLSSASNKCTQSPYNCITSENVLRVCVNIKRMRERECEWKWEKNRQFLSRARIEFIFHSKISVLMRMSISFKVIWTQHSLSPLIALHIFFRFYFEQIRRRHRHRPHHQRLCQFTVEYVYAYIDVHMYQRTNVYRRVRFFTILIIYSRNSIFNESEISLQKIYRNKIDHMHTH